MCFTIEICQYEHTLIFSFQFKRQCDHVLETAIVKARLQCHFAGRLLEDSKKYPIILNLLLALIYISYINFFSKGKIACNNTHQYFS